MLLERGFGSYYRACLQCSVASAAPQLKLQTVRLAIISEGVNTWPLYVAQEKKLFQKEGIEVEVTLTGSSVKQLDRLKAGGFDIGFQQSDHVVSGVENGADLFIFMALAHAPELSLAVAPGIRSFADLEGRDIAVDGARSGYALLLRKLLADKGLEDGDYVFREIGGSQERFDALKNGIAVASMLNPPFDRELFAAGFGSLGTVSDYYPTYPGAIAAARRSWGKRNAPQIIAFIRGFRAAYTWLQDKNNKSEAIAILPERLKVTPDTASRAYDQFVVRPRPQITPQSLQQVIDIVWEAEGLTGPKGAPDKYMDLGYLHKAMQPQAVVNAK